MVLEVSGLKKFEDQVISFPGVNSNILACLLKHIPSMVAKLLEVHPKHRLLAILRRCQLRELDDAAIFHKDGEGVSGALERQASTTGRTKSLPMAPGPFFLSQLSSWRYTVGMGLVVTIAVLLCNIGLLIYTHFAETSPSGNALLYRGDCERQSFVNSTLARK